MKLLIRDKVINLNDDLEVKFAAEYYFWDEYKRLLQSANNIAAKKDLSNYKNALNFKFDNGGLESIRENIEREFGYQWISEDKCIGKIEGFGTKQNLLIYVCSHAGIENRMSNTILSIPDRIRELSDRFDILVLNEHPLRFPESLYPAYLTLGCSEENNTFEKMCKSLEKSIEKNYDTVLVLGDSKHAAITLSIAHKLHKIVTNVFLIHGQTSYDWDESGWVQSYLKYLKKRDEVFEKTGHRDDSMIHNISGPHIFHILKTYKLKQLGISNEILSPFKYHKNYNIKVDYYYSEHDIEYAHFIKWLKENKTGNIQLHKVDYVNKSNPHFIRPYIERNVLPNYIDGLLNE